MTSPGTRASTRRLASSPRRSSWAPAPESSRPWWTFSKTRIAPCGTGRRSASRPSAPRRPSAADALKTALDDPSPNVRFTAAGTLCRLGQTDRALPVLAQGLLDSREVVALYAARTVESLGDKARPIVLQMASARERCKNIDGSYKNDNYAMFIDWALKHALESCKE